MALQRASTWGWLGLLLSIVLLGCSNGSGSVADGDSSSPAGESPPPAGGAQGGSSTYSISAAVSGLVGDGLVLQNNGANDIPVAANGRLTFGEAIANGDAYNVTVLSQPTNPAQNCSVVGGVGTVANADVTNISVTCATPDAQSFAVGGTVTGLSGTGLVLRINGGETTPIVADGQFTFATALPTGTAYTVDVVTHPSNPAQTCSVNNNEGTVGTQDVTNVAVTCSATSFAVQINVSGLQGLGLQLQLNGNDVLSASGNGPYTFGQLVPKGAPYNVRVITQPTNPKQTCVVTNSSGTIADANVTNVAVSCTKDQAIGGSVKDLAGRGLVLQLNGANNLPITSSGSFEFSTVLPTGSQYSVTVLTQPSNPTQDCTVKNASGAVGSASVNIIGVTCTTTKFKVNVTVSGLIGTGRDLRLRNEWSKGHDDLDFDVAGTKAFPTALDSGTQYTVSVQRKPNKPRQECSIDAPTGTIGSADVTVNVTCAAPTDFAITGSVAGLEGQGLQLQNNAADTLAVAPGATVFEFPGLIHTGSNYDVTVVAQPSSPTQVCSVTTGSGTVSNADVSNVSVGCVTQPFTVGGSVSGLSFPGVLFVQLQLNGGQSINVVLGQPTFTFPNSVLSGTPYEVTVAGQPPGRVCTVANGSGIMGGANITNVAVTCN